METNSQVIFLIMSLLLISFITSNVNTQKITLRKYVRHIMFTLLFDLYQNRKCKFKSHVAVMPKNKGFLTISLGFFLGTKSIGTLDMVAFLLDVDNWLIDQTDESRMWRSHLGRGVTHATPIQKYDLKMIVTWNLTFRRSLLCSVNFES